MPSEERWEFDVAQLTVDDFILLEDAETGILGRVRGFKEMLGRLMVNMTADDIGELTIPELAELVETIQKEAVDTALPKATTTD